jgi:hypothetical protein
MTSDLLFQWIEKIHGPAWGDTLDAGTGDHSLEWLRSCGPRRLTAVTVEEWRMAALQAKAPEARLILGQWSDPSLLSGEQFDTILVDYVIGSIDGHAPYFQYAYLQRLRPHLRPGGAMYLVGMEPPPSDGSELDQIHRLRDACILLAGHRCYREYPQSVVLQWLEQAGYAVQDATLIPNRLGARYIHGQLDVARRKLQWIADRNLAAALGARIEALRERALERGERSFGADWVIAVRG